MHMCLPVNPRKPPCNHSFVKNPQNFNRLAIHPGPELMAAGTLQTLKLPAAGTAMCTADLIRAIAGRILCLMGLWYLHYNSVHIHCSVLIAGFNNEGENCLAVVTVICVFRWLPGWLFLLFCQLPVKANRNGILPHSNTHGDICCNVCTHTLKWLLTNKENSFLMVTPQKRE